ncbi:MAG: hypothetical protein IJH71_02530 [Eubacterium sp.]|nr:hypothetical protein [Eubacterium sp.]
MNTGMNTFEMDIEKTCMLEAYMKERENEAAFPDDLESAADGSSLDGEDYITVDMSEYHCTWLSYAMGRAMMDKAQGYSCEAAIQEIYNHYYNKAHIIMQNLNQCITPERWNRINRTLCLQV